MTRYATKYSPAARRAIAHVLPEKVAAAAVEFIEGPLADNPRRVGKQLLPPLDKYFGARRGSYRVIYEIADQIVTIEIVTIAHRRDAYRRR